MSEITRIVCQSCEAQKISLIDTGQAQLCLDCYIRFQQAQALSRQAETEQLQLLQNQIAWAGQMMEFQIGFRKNVPIFENPTRKKIMNQNINFSNNTVGLLNTGELQATTIQASTYNQNNSALEKLEILLKQLLDAAKECKELDNENKHVYADLLMCIAKEMQKSVTQRKTSVLKTAIEKLSTLSEAATKLQTLWNICRPAILAFFAIHT